MEVIKIYSTNICILSDELLKTTLQESLLTTRKHSVCVSVSSDILNTDKAAEILLCKA